MFQNLYLSSRFRRCLLLLMMTAGLFLVASAHPSDAKATVLPPNPIEGRWDITISTSGGELPSWVEIWQSGYEAFVGEFVGAIGSARPISRIDYQNGQVSFTLPPQWEQERKDLTFTGRLDGDRLSGTMNYGDGKEYKWTAVRAPALVRSKTPSWGKTVPLLAGPGLAGWHVTGPNNWELKNGILTNKKAGGNLVSDRKLNDFKLHLEFRLPKESNSGVYLRGRYEVQIADSTGGEPPRDQLGALYGFLPPSDLVSKANSEWQTLDIVLVGRKVTITANGTTVVCNGEIPGITGGALDSRENEPGPIFLQGDHGPVEFRNMRLTESR